jgi:hypothetical protein
MKENSILYDKRMKSILPVEGRSIIICQGPERVVLEMNRIVKLHGSFYCTEWLKGADASAWSPQALNL